jgi:hypothetical protein
MLLELARSQHVLAHIDLESGDHHRALQLLDEASPTYDRLGLRRYLEEAIAKKEILKA